MHDMKTYDCVALVHSTFFVSFGIFLPLMFLLLLSYWIDRWLMLCRHELIIHVAFIQIAFTKTVRSDSHLFRANTAAITATSSLGVHVLSSSIICTVETHLWFYWCIIDRHWYREVVNALDSVANKSKSATIIYGRLAL